jgi:hypothetical protein
MMVRATLFLIGLHRDMLLILQNFPGAVSPVPAQMQGVPGAWGAATTALIFAFLTRRAGAPS